MKILVVGGGSGGHVTPVIAVVKEILKTKPKAEVKFWTDRKYFVGAKTAVSASGLNIPIKKISAGKLRRYTNFKFFDYLAHPGIVFANFVDVFKIIAGLWQSFWRLAFDRPNVIFLKGGYACLPVGMVAKVLRIPYVIHDSDAAPGLTNRVLAGGAAKIATGMPLYFYKYPESKAIWTGIPISSAFESAKKSNAGEMKKALGFDEKRCLTVVTGGSLGSEHMNFAVRDVIDDLLKTTNLVLITGKKNYQNMHKLKKLEGEHFKMLDFTSEIVKYFEAADIVVSRAGASTISELASLKKCVILIPNYKLPGFHQLKNAEKIVNANAAVMVDDGDYEADGAGLLKAVQDLSGDAGKRKKMGEKLGTFAKTGAAEELAKVILEVAK